MVDKANSRLYGPKCLSSKDKELFTISAESAFLFYNTLFIVASILAIVFIVSISDV